MSTDILLRTVQHGRGPGVLAAFTIFLAISFTAHPPVDVLQMLAVFLPALEVGLFTLVVAVVRDENPHCLGPSSAFAIWASAAFVGMWVLVEMTEAAINAYVELGLPPIYGPMI
jgi:hypothetical protein